MESLAGVEGVLTGRLSAPTGRLVEGLAEVRSKQYDGGKALDHMRQLEEELQTLEYQQKRLDAERETMERKRQAEMDAIRLARLGSPSKATTTKLFSPSQSGRDLSSPSSQPERLTIDGLREGIRTEKIRLAKTPPTYRYSSTASLQ